MRSSYALPFQGYLVRNNKRNLKVQICASVTHTWPTAFEPSNASIKASLRSVYVETSEDIVKATFEAKILIFREGTRWGGGGITSDTGSFYSKSTNESHRHFDCSIWNIGNDMLQKLSLSFVWPNLWVWSFVDLATVLTENAFKSHRKMKVIIRKEKPKDIRSGESSNN